MPRFRWEDYVNALKPGDVFARRVFAEHFGVGGSTARYHLERAVEAGAIHKQYGWVGGQSGWLYGLPETLLKLEGM